MQRCSNVANKLYLGCRYVAATLQQRCRNVVATLQQPNLPPNTTTLQRCSNVAATLFCNVAATGKGSESHLFATLQQRCCNLLQRKYNVAATLYLGNLLAGYYHKYISLRTSLNTGDGHSPRISYTIVSNLLKIMIVRYRL